jgi:hypothetical protein
VIRIKVVTVRMHDFAACSEPRKKRMQAVEVWTRNKILMRIWRALLLSIVAILIETQYVLGCEPSSSTKKIINVFPMCLSISKQRMKTFIIFPQKTSLRRWMQTLDMHSYDCAVPLHHKSGTKWLFVAVYNGL